MSNAELLMTADPALAHEAFAEPVEQERLSLRERAAGALGKFATRAGAVVAAVGLSLGLAQPAEASDRPSCYGDYCSGQYADEAGCDKNVRTIAKAVITRTGLNITVTASSEPSISAGTGERVEVGLLELRRSDECGTTWARLSTKGGKSVGFTGINFVGVEQDGGYTQKRDIGGRFNGSPAANSFTPMIYGRDNSYRAFVESKDYWIAYEDGTYWTQ